MLDNRVNVLPNFENFFDLNVVYNINHISDYKKEIVMNNIIIKKVKNIIISNEKKILKIEIRHINTKGDVFISVFNGEYVKYLFNKNGEFMGKIKKNRIPFEIDNQEVKKMLIGNCGASLGADMIMDKHGNSYYIYLYTERLSKRKWGGRDIWKQLWPFHIYILKWQRKGI